MKKVNVEDAAGMTLCHDITAMFDGFKGALFKRGQVIRKEDIPRLLETGDRRLTGPTMPPQGLYMNRVWYDGPAGEMMAEGTASRDNCFFGENDAL